VGGEGRVADADSAVVELDLDHQPAQERKPAMEPVTSATRSLAAVQKWGGIGATGPTHSQMVERTS
jgi:hypothetical protein